MLARMYGRPPVDLIDLAGERPGVFGQDACPFFRRQQFEVERVPLADDFAIPAEQDQPAQAKQT